MGGERLAYDLRYADTSSSSTVRSGCERWQAAKPINEYGRLHNISERMELKCCRPFACPIYHLANTPSSETTSKPISISAIRVCQSRITLGGAHLRLDGAMTEGPGKTNSASKNHRWVANATGARWSPDQVSVHIRALAA